MITALFHKPNDRQFIITLENSISSFIDSNADSCELAPMNSYFRLLSHQIAEYHNLKHVLARTHDNCVIIFKGPGFVKTSRPLLQDLSTPECDFIKQNNSISRDSELVKDGTENGNIKKYKILKRSEEKYDASNSMDLNESGNEQEDNLSLSEASLEEKRIEREKEYELRKHQIFDTPKKSDDSDFINGESENHSPQPHQFETSRFRTNQFDNVPPPKFRYNRRKKGYNNQNNGGYVSQYYTQAHGNNRHPSFNYSPMLTNNEPLGGYVMVSPYMMYPPPPMVNDVASMYSVPVPMYQMGPMGPYMNPNQIPVPYNQSHGFATSPPYYGNYTNNHVSNGAASNNQPRPSKQINTAPVILDTTSNKSSQIQQNDVEEDATEKAVEKVANELKELYV